MKLINKIKSKIFKRHRDRAQLCIVSNTDRILRIDGHQIPVGKFTYGMENISLIHHPDCPPLSIGRYCSIGRKLTIILGAYHRHDWVSTYPFSWRHQNIWETFGKIETPGFPKSKGSVAIGNDVWIGHAATIMSGIKVGDGAVIAAGAHVIRDVQPYEIVGGNPAKHIGFRFSHAVIQQLMDVRWWEFPEEVIKEIASHLCSEPEEKFLSRLKTIRHHLLNEKD